MMYGLEMPETEVSKVFGLRDGKVYIKWWRPAYYRALLRNPGTREMLPTFFVGKVAWFATVLIFALKTNLRHS